MQQQQQQQQQQQLQQQSGAATGTATNGGPRVSFNRDVHVKRIGKRPSEYESSQVASYHQLPPDIDPADIRKEAALVIAQAGRHHSKAENGDRENISNFRSKQKRQSDAQRFHSLPTRRKKGKPVARSASDASSKKPASKRPSIFGLFSRKSDSNVNQLERDPRFEDGGARRLVRSKSDVGGRSPESRVTKRPEAATAGSATATGSASKQQLSPIIEQAQREDFFEKDYFRERERRKSDAVTLREKDESGLSELLNRSRSQVEPDASLLKREPAAGGHSSSASISAGIRDRIDTLRAKSNENMHSSQQPAERLPLTKGRTVDGLVKRLSMERFSPQPHISQPGFSYIRPNEGITYAQLDHSPLEESRQRSPLGRDMRSPQRDFAPARPPRANDRAQHSPGESSYSPTAPLPPRVSHSHSHSHSPSPWQQLSPRNLSDEDEGLGYEPRKVYYEDEYPPRRPEPPIVPVIRSVSPAPYLDELGYRRAQLETRILTRRFGEGAATLERHNRVEQQPERERERERDRGRVYLSPERDEERFQRVAARPTELSNEYPAQQERSQVDGTLPKMEKTSRYRHTKYYDDGHGGVKETYVRETQKDGQIRESRHRERMGERERDYNSADRLEHEPKSLDSQLTGTDLYRSSPELRPNQHQQQQQQQQQQSAVQQQDYWQSSLKRDKLQQRSFDKGDSGIENDFRKESFNGDLTTRWRKRTAIDDMRACESFLRKERRDSAQQRQLQRQAIIPARLRRENSYVYRERSIDDGSHFDPHLDKYPVATSTLRRREQHSQSQSQSQSQSREDSSTLKRNKKLGGFEKVKQLFTGAASGSHGGSGRSSGSNVSSGKKERLSNSNSSTLSRRDKEKQKERERYMVREEEMRSRYREHQALAEENSREPKTIDISMRRRLSTPKASPLLLKRSSADKPPKKLPQKAKEATPVKVEKTSWFKSLDRRAKSSPKELNVSVNGHSENTSSLKRSKRNATAAPAKNLRFFGDTDLDSNPPTISKASSMPRSRPSLGQSKHSQSAYNLDRSPPPPSRDYRHTLSGQSQGSQSAVSSRQRASSMQHLDNGSDEVDFRKRRHYSRSRELHDISESGSEPEPAERHKRSSTQRAMSLERSAAEGQRGQRFEDRPLMGPPKPARSAERRGLLSSLGQENVGYGRDRFPAESSGTEGESSLHSQRSVVYLHATTVGDIPQPYNLRRRSVSREDLRKGGASKQQQQQPPPLQPMTRTVSRSVSMLAPWKPKHISEGYEINYSQEQNKRMSTLPRKPPPHNGATSASTLSRLGRKNETSTSTSTLTPSRRYHMDSLDRPPPPRSVLSASNLRSAKTK
ncbi:zinc finger CCCH domain-containing protein 13 isoform X2 [Drosophila subobscura]|uniref:zinc finger CCCH domain-containing protein 13 isoform X2 n=1 Tax=Drosophila subobscura TaxID=7241 RepID=UPI00155B33F0|nr:zinc finger CCCH domain-containing protein 13 isoform X2 [Drosophila subobscura]